MVQRVQQEGVIAVSTQGDGTASTAVRYSNRSSIVNFINQLAQK
jgi:hypothetical protein